MSFIRRRVARLGVVAIGCLIILLGSLSSPAGVSAHERRDVLGGHYQLAVGWLNEPAYDHQLNSLDLTVTDKTQKGDDGKDKPVQDLDQTLKVEILTGGGRMALKLQPRFGFPGKYLAPVVPTKPGLYSFRIFGTIGGQALDERFDSGPNTFDDVTALAALQFPPEGAVAPTQAVPAPLVPPTPAAAPSVVGPTSPAQSAALPATAPPAAQQPVAPAAPPPAVALPAEYQGRLDAALSAADSARTDARGARMLGIGGLVVGTLGLTAAILALARRPTRELRARAEGDNSLDD